MATPLAGIGSLVFAQLKDRRRSLLAWGLPLGLMAAFEVAIFPSIEEALVKTIDHYPVALREAFGITELSTVEQFLGAELLGFIIPLAAGYLAVRSVAAGLSGAAESGRLEVLLSGPVARRQLVVAGFLATGLELAIVLLAALLPAMLASLLFGAGLSFAAALAGFANVWPLALLFAGLGIVVTGLSLRTSVVTGSVAGILVAMYVVDLIGRVDHGLSGIRYLSVFKYYGDAILDGIDPLSFLGVLLGACLLAALGTWLFDRRDLVP